MSETAYEKERLETIAANRALLAELGLSEGGASTLDLPKSASPKPRSRPKPSSSTRKRKHAEEHAPTRRSGRLAGVKADPEQLEVFRQEEEKVREEARVRDRRVREQVMGVGEQLEEDSASVEGLEKLLRSVPECPRPDLRNEGKSGKSGQDGKNVKVKEEKVKEEKVKEEKGEEKEKEKGSKVKTDKGSRVKKEDVEEVAEGKEAYDVKDTDADIDRLKAHFKGMYLAANKKITTERVYTMLVHPDPTRNMVLVGDKYGQLGVWDAPTGSVPAENGDDVKKEVKEEAKDVKTEEDADGEQEEEEDGRVWRLQTHAKNSISCMKVDPANGQSLITSSYDCTLRKLDFSTCTSTEIFSFDDEDMLVTHFDLVPSGQEAWIVDKHGGISHADFREGGERRRWEVQEAGRGAKLGGVSVNPLMPHLLVTASNDQHLRIWDTRHLRKLTPKAAETIPPPPKREDGKEYIDTHCQSSIPYDRVQSYMDGKSGKGLLRASYQHGKSCSAAYWDPFGRRILTTSYDDKLRVFNINPQQLMFDTPLPASQFKPAKTIAHNCQTGRWLTILRAQWSQNTDFAPHFSVGNMKRRLDVFAATGERIVSLWNDEITAVPAVTAAHPAHVDRLVGGNTSGRVQLWTSGAE